MKERYVSIILPTYNRAHCIRESVESIRRQTYPYWELLVIDDGSTDNTEEIVTEIMSQDPRVHYYMQSNKGVSAARNEGIRRAEYEYIAFQDSDDIWKEEKLEKQMQVFRDKPEVGLVYCAYDGVQGGVVARRIPDSSLGIDQLSGNLYRQLLSENVIGTPTAVIRRECLSKCGLFNEALTCLEDWELFLRIAKDYEIGYVDESLLIVDWHIGGVNSNIAGHFQTICMIIAQHRASLLEYGIFEQVVGDMLTEAQKWGILKPVAQMLEKKLL